MTQVFIMMLHKRIFINDDTATARPNASAKAEKSIRIKGTRTVGQVYGSRNSYFEEDLFNVFDEESRPDYCWLIIGPERSGSSFHKDPNSTSAWNGVIQGRKKWMLCPTASPPPVFIPSEDGGNITGPVCEMEWFLNYYDAGHEYGKTVDAVECVVSSGEMMFLSAGWWHIVLNLDFTIEITQNYASSVNVVSVAKWLKFGPQQISGCESEKQKTYISSNFKRLVAEKRPDLRRRLRANRMLTAEDGAIFLADTDYDYSDSSMDEEYSASEMGDNSSPPKDSGSDSVSKDGSSDVNGALGIVESKQNGAIGDANSGSSPEKRNDNADLREGFGDSVKNGPTDPGRPTDGPAAGPSVGHIQ